MSGGGTAPARDTDADEQIVQDPTLPDPVVEMSSFEFRLANAAN
jgi:hypothetical protein